MDDVDVRLCGMLILDSRISYRDLSDRLGLSIQAVHRRIQVLQAHDVIRGFTASLSFSYLNAAVAYIFGTSEAKSMDQVVQALSLDDRTYIVVVTGRNRLSIGAVLRDHSDLDDYVGFVKREAKLTDLAIGLMSMTRVGADRTAAADREASLTPLDYRIVRTLKDDSRQPVEDIASELHVSAATARRRLSRLIDIGAISTTIDWHPSASGEIVAQLHIRMNQGADRSKVINDLAGKSDGRIISVITFSNLPDFIFLVVWAPTLKGIDEITGIVRDEGGVDSVFPDIIISEHRFDTWVDRLVAERAASGSVLKDHQQSR